ncbi:MAG: TlpA family protein disulfide reductase [Anaerolinea sp.]|nr:TlpA family protein disulfide reductase [Anaerolinea sp.]
MPLLINVYQRYQSESLVILGLNVTEQDSLEAVTAFVEEFDVPFPVLLDEAGHVSNDAYGMMGLPMSVFIDRNGIVKRVVLGALVSDEVDGYIAEIMSQGE